MYVERIEAIIFHLTDDEIHTLLQKFLQEASEPIPVIVAWAQATNNAEELQAQLET